MVKVVVSFEGWHVIKENADDGEEKPFSYSVNFNELNWRGLYTDVVEHM